MKTNYQKSFFAGVLAFIVGTSCCWLTSLAVWLGGATILSVLSNFVGRYGVIMLAAALLFFVVGLYQLWGHRNEEIR